MNGVGLEFNHLFGFGVLDAGAMVALAKQWRSVPARYHCEAGSDKTVTSIALRNAEWVVSLLCYVPTLSI